MAFKEVGRGGGPIFKWDVPGKNLTGVYHGLKSGRTFAGNAEPSKLAVIETDSGVQVCGAPKALASTLSESVKVGQTIRITYKGLERGATGVNYKAFTVEVDSEAPGVGIDAPSTQPATSNEAEYSALVAKLQAKVGPDTARLMTQMLERQPDRLAALRNLLVQQGVQV